MRHSSASAYFVCVYVRKLLNISFNDRRDLQMIVMLMVVATVYTSCYFPINIVWVSVSVSVNSAEYQSQHLWLIS